MADIRVQCTKCNNAIAVSEFVDFTALKCRKCGGAMVREGEVPVVPVPAPAAVAPGEPVPEPAAPVAAAVPAGTARRKLKVREQEAEAAAEAPKSGGDGGRWQELQRMKHAQKAKDAKKVRIPPQVWWWLIFVLLGGVMGFLRYGGVLGKSALDSVAMVAPFIGLALHLYLLTLAFKDSVFHGILALLVPGYSLYYLFLISDKFILRSAIGGLVVGIGQDAGTWYFKQAAVFAKAASEWINAGGGSIQ